MKWTRDKPTTPGWYWYKSGVDGIFSLVTIYQVIDLENGEELQVYVTDSDSYPVSDLRLDGEWAGPVPEPGGRMKTLQQQAEALLNGIDGKVNMYSDVRREVKSLILAFAEQIQAQERARCAEIAENGRFLHDDAPDARFGKACAQAIREQKEDV